MNRKGKNISNKIWLYLTAIFNSDSDSGEASNVVTKTRNLDQKLTEISSKGQKPTVNAIAQGFQPSRQTLATQVNK